MTIYQVYDAIHGLVFQSIDKESAEHVAATDWNNAKIFVATI